MKKVKRIMSLLLIFALTSGILISCGNNNANNANDATTNAASVAADSTTGSQPDTEPVLTADIPADSDFGGYTFTFLAHLYDGDDWVSTTPLELVAQLDEATGKEVENSEPINDAVYKRNLKIKEQLNINIKMIADANEQNAMKKAVNSGDSTYDAVIMFNNNVPGIVTGNLLTNVADLPYIDLEKPWWDPAVNALSIDHKNFLLGGDLLILDNEATNVLLFNKDMMGTLGLDLPYNLVREGKWTMDKFGEYIKGATTDLNGDGVITPKDDRWGFVCFNDTMHALFVSGGGALAVKDENDLPYMDFTSAQNLAVLDKVMNIMYDKTTTLNVQSDTPSAEWTPVFYGSFEQNRALFLWARLRVVEKYRGMEANFGIIPLPKYDELQKDYRSVVNPYTGVLLGVPKSAGDLERDSIILEALSAESRYTLKPAYYDVVLQRKYVRDDESGEMLDIIFNSRIYDIGSIYSFGNVFMDFIGLCYKSDRNVVSYYDKKIGAMQKSIDKVVATFQNMD